MTTTAQGIHKPKAAECSCTFARYAMWHDKLIALEDMTPVEAAYLVAVLVSDDDLNNVIEGIGDYPTPDPDDFERFVLEHNWNEPVRMATLAKAVSYGANKVWRHDVSRRPAGWEPAA